MIVIRGVTSLEKKCTQNTARGRYKGPNWVLDKALVENDVYALAYMYLRIGSYAPGNT